MAMQSRECGIRRILGGVVMAILLGFGLLGAHAVSLIHDHLATAAEETVVGYARLVGQSHTLWTEQSRGVMATVAAMVADGAAEPAACTALLTAVVAETEGWDIILVAEPDGRVRCASRPMTNTVSVADRPYFRRAVDSRDFTYGSYVLGRISGQQVMPFAYPLLDGRGKVVLVVLAGRRADRLQQMVEGLALPANTQVSLIGRSGLVLAQVPGNGGIDKVLPLPRWSPPRLAPARRWSKPRAWTAPRRCTAWPG